MLYHRNLSDASTHDDGNGDSTIVDFSDAFVRIKHLINVFQDSSALSITF